MICYGIVMKYCPSCGAENKDDSRFCYSCGAMLSPGETDQNIQNDPFTSQDKNTSFEKEKPERRDSIVPYLLIGLIAAVAILGFALVPPMINNEADYEVTVTVDSLGVNDMAHQYVVDGSGNVKAWIEIGYGATSPDSHIKYSPWTVKPDGTLNTFSVSKTVTIHGNPDKFVFTMFLMVDIGSGMNDYVDIFTDTIDGPVPTYIGFSGVQFYKADLDANGKVVFRGDSDPIGEVHLTVSFLKK